MSGIKGFKQINVDDLNLNMIQDNVQQCFDDVLKKDLIDGIPLDNLVMKSGDNTISHGLNRTLKGYFVYRKSAAGDIFDKQSTNNQAKATLILNVANPMTISLWVF